MSKTAIIIGASGLLGNALLQRLLHDTHYSRVKAFVRNPLALNHPKLEQIVVNFDKIRNYEEDISGDVFFCCIGTTRRKTPDKQMYYRIDHDYPVLMATIAANNGVATFHLISSIGANERSRMFYPRLKGVTERDIAAIPFKAIHIYRPSFLSGQRNETRIWESIGLRIIHILKPLLLGPFKKYRSIHVDTIAAAMTHNESTEQEGLYIYESDTIQKLGKGQ
jgi:uncharacterized protein YbjT (DUF2867 family)